MVDFAPDPKYHVPIEKRADTGAFEVPLHKFVETMSSQHEANVVGVIDFGDGQSTIRAFRYQKNGKPLYCVSIRREQHGMPVGSKGKPDSAAVEDKDIILRFSSLDALKGAIACLSNLVSAAE